MLPWPILLPPIRFYYNPSSSSYVILLTSKLKVITTTLPIMLKEMQFPVVHCRHCCMSSLYSCLKTGGSVSCESSSLLIPINLSSEQGASSQSWPLKFEHDLTVLCAYNCLMFMLRLVWFPVQVVIHPPLGLLGGWVGDNYRNFHHSPIKKG